MIAETTHRSPRGSRGTRAILILLFLTATTRAVTFGNPIVDMDDQFYWLVGQRMWRGDWPILDIWDRKPVGLFILYGAIASVGRSILAVQIAATLFAVGTALLVRAIALRIASPRAALLSAASYALLLPLFGGQSGQSPVFYNLFIAGAGLLLLSASEILDAGAIRRRALWAMLLSGVALVIKQVSVAEGVYFGLAFLFLLHRAGQPIRRIVATAAMMILVALLPTLLGAALFATRGEEAVTAYLQASYFSIFAKTPGGYQSLFAGVAYLLIFAGPLLLAAGIGVAVSWKDMKSHLALRLTGFWIVASFAGYVLVPNFFPHYALPMFVPLSVLAARAFDRPIGTALFITLLASCLISGRLTDLRGSRRAAADFHHVAATIGAARRGGCVYVANGPVALYAAAPDCGRSPYLFPYHLTLATEATSIEVDQSAEITRIFAARPAIVVTQADKQGKQSPRVRATLDRQLATNYRPIVSLPQDAAEELRTLRVWQRRDLAR